MVEFIGSPTFKWLDEHKPKKSFIMCSPYIKRYLVDIMLADHIKDCSDVKVLIRGRTEEFLEFGSSDIEVLDSFLFKNGFDIDNFRRVTNLHMKAYLVDEKDLLVTSGNMTFNGMFLGNGDKNTGNFEGGIYTNDPTVIDQFLKYFYNIWENGEVLTDFYDEVEVAYQEYIKERVVNKSKRKKRKKTGDKQYADLKEETMLTHLIPFSEMPRNTKIEDIIPTLKSVDNAENLNNYLNYESLGDVLRTKYNIGWGFDAEDAQKKSTNDKKVGEERIKTARFLGLAYIDTMTSPYQLHITGTGKRYLSALEHERKEILYEQLERNEIFQMLNEHFSDQEIKDMEESDKSINILKRVVQESVDGSDKSIQRIYTICKDLLVFYYKYEHNMK